MASASLQRLQPAAASSAAREVAPTLVALALTSGILFNGYNSAAGQAISCLVNAVTLAALILFWPVGPAFWARLRPVLILAALAAGWLMLIAFLPVEALGLPTPPRYAPDLVEPQLLSLTSAAAALVAGAMLGNDRIAANRTIERIVLLCAVYLAIGLVLRYFGNNDVLSFWSVQRDARFQGTLGNVNATSAVAGGTAFIALSRYVYTRRLPRGGELSGRSVRWAAIAYIAAFAIALVATLATGSRFVNLLVLTAIIGVIIGAFVFILMRRRMSARGWAVLALPGATLLAVAAVSSDILIKRSSAMAEGLSTRMGMWGRYWEAVQTHPIYGYGPGAFPVLNTRWLTDPRFAQANWTVNSAHGIVLQILVNGGLPYLLLILAATALVLRPVLHALRRRRDICDFGVAGALLVLAGCASIDITFDVPATLGLAMLLAGILWGGAIRDEVRVARPHRQPA
jgi:O-antigen ligase